MVVWRRSTIFNRIADAQKEKPLPADTEKGLGFH
jgi:hypothetical protein